MFTLMHPTEMLVVHGPQETLLFKSVSGQVKFYGWTSRAMRGKKFVLRGGINHQFGLFHSTIMPQAALSSRTTAESLLRRILARTPATPRNRAIRWGRVSLTSTDYR